MIKAAVLATIDATGQKVDALVSLAASLPEGIRATVVDPDPLYLLVSTMAEIIGGSSTSPSNQGKFLKYAYSDVCHLISVTLASFALYL